MRTGFAALIACSMVLLAAGCGSSSKSSGSTASTSATGTKAGSVSRGKSELKGDTRPKFAEPSKSTPVKSGTVEIAYRNFTIQPDTVRVKSGSTIKWTNYDSSKCNVTSEGGPQRIASKDFGEGGSFEVKVNKTGKIHYECTLFPTTMNGTIEVSE